MRRIAGILMLFSFIALLSYFLPAVRGPHRVGVPTVLADEGSPECLLPPESDGFTGHQETWLPTTPEPRESKIPGNRSGGTDCPFYRPAWQRFMFATQPLGDAPAFLGYPSVDDLFSTGGVRSGPAAVAHPLQLSLHPRNIQMPNSPTESQQELLDRNRGQLNDINQAGARSTVGGNLIDQHGHLVYYAIHVSPSFAAFLTARHLRTPDDIRHLDANLTFPASADQPSVMELKSAWMIVKSPREAPNYFVVRAEVPRYTVKANVLQPQRCFLTHKLRTRKVWVALLALHVVFTLPGHPEMIWSTFEHTHFDQGLHTDVRDNAPAGVYPEPNPDIDIVDNTTYQFPLYRRGTTYTAANKPATPTDMANHWDTRSQSFTRGGLLQTSVYRPYPASKSRGDATKPPPEEDDEVVRINNNARAMFDAASKNGQMPASDMRRNYRLVGAVWLDAPLDTPGKPGTFIVNRSFFTKENTSTDDDTSIVAGEGRLGSTAMESFTEMELDKNGAPSCFSCHDTRGINRASLPPQLPENLLPPAQLNVSHVLSKYLETLPSPPPQPTPGPSPAPMR